MDVLKELQREDAKNDVEENNTNTEDNIRDGEEESIQSMFSQGQRVSHSHSERSSTKKKKSAGFEDFAEAIIESTLLLVGEIKESST